jgi:hypothetical protein
MAKSLNIVIGADIEKLREGFNKAIQVVQSSGKRMSDDVAKSAKSMEERLASIATRNPTMGSVRQLTQLAMEARALGPEFAQVANEIIKQAGRMKDAIADTRGEVGYFASDTRKLDAVLGGIQGMAGAFSAVQGAMAMAGVENKDLQATMVKLQGAMALVSGLQAVQNTLQQESAAVQGFLALRTTVLTAAQTAYATASAGAIGTQRALNIAMAAAPYALAIAAISAIVISIASYADKIKKVSAEQKLFNEINSETQKNFEEEVKSVSGLLAVVNNHNASMKERRNALAEIQKIYPDFLANQSLDKVSSEQLKTATSNLTAEIYKQAKAKAAFTKLQELSAKMIDYELGKQQAQLSTQAEINRLYASGATASQVQGFIESQQNLGIAAAQNAVKIQSQIDAIINMSNAQGLSITPITKTTTAIEKQTAAVVEATNAAKAADVSGFKPSEQFAAPSAPTLTKFRGAYGSHDMTKDLQKNTGEQVKIMSDYEQKMASATDAVNSSFASLQTDAANSFAQFVADTAAGDANAGKNFGKSMMGAIANFMQSVGAALITTAIASKAFKELILQNPVAAAAAGVALVAGAAILRAQLSEGPNITAFADGGIVSGPTLGLMGEYPNARSNPEVIAPLDKLKGMLKSGDSSSGFVASTSIQGRDLAIVLERYNKDSKRG